MSPHGKELPGAFLCGSVFLLSVAVGSWLATRAPPAPLAHMENDDYFCRSLVRRRHKLARMQCGLYFLGTLSYSVVILESYDLAALLGHSATDSGWLVGLPALLQILVAIMVRSGLKSYARLRWMCFLSLAWWMWSTWLYGFAADPWLPLVSDTRFVLLCVARITDAIGTASEYLLVTITPQLLTADERLTFNIYSTSIGTLGFGLGPVLANLVAQGCAHDVPSRAARPLYVVLLLQAAALCLLYRLFPSEEEWAFFALSDERQKDIISEETQGEMFKQDESAQHPKDVEAVQTPLYQRAIWALGAVSNACRPLIVSSVEVATAMVLEVEFRWDTRSIGYFIGASFLFVVPVNLVVVQSIRYSTRASASDRVATTCALGTVLGSLLFFPFVGTSPWLLFSSDALVFSLAYAENGVVNGIVSRSIGSSATFFNWQNYVMFTKMLTALGRLAGPVVTRTLLVDLGRSAYAGFEFGLASLLFLIGVMVSLVDFTKEAAAAEPPCELPRRLVFQLGSNSWQRQQEFAPGSAILHASHHHAWNAMPSTKCYSMYPSERQTQPGDDDRFRVFQLRHPVPICESVSPNSSYRWHAMSEEEVSAYICRLEEEVYQYMGECEAREQATFQVVIAHHAFVNPVVMQRVLRRRVAEGKPRAAVFCFLHGTALKMYEHELSGDPDFLLRFKPWMDEQGVFLADGDVATCFAISQEAKDKFLRLFPQYQPTRVVVSPVGINSNVFVSKDVDRASVLSRHIPASISPNDAGLMSISRWVTAMVIFAGKFADWKRLDAVLLAAKAYTQQFPSTATVIVGQGSAEDDEKYHAMARDLGLQRTYFLGAKPQSDLAELFAAASVGVFPSWQEPGGQVFIECCSCGTPVIGAASGGPREFVSPAVGALVPEPAQKFDHQVLGASLAAAVAEALRDDWKAAKGDACRALAREHSVAAQVARLGEVCFAVAFGD